MKPLCNCLHYPVNSFLFTSYQIPSFCVLP